MARYICLALLLATACGGSAQETNVPSSTDPCADEDLAVKRVWNEETRVNVKAQVMSWGGEFGVDLAKEKAEAVVNTMDHVSDDWARMRKAVCKDHFVRQTLDKQQYQHRADCLDRVLTRQRTFLSAVSAHKADVSEELSAISSELEACSGQ